MHKVGCFLLLGSLLLGCKTNKAIVQTNQEIQTITSESDPLFIAFGSCNKHNEPNVFWDDILEVNPAVFIWGGDNIYADTEDMSKMQEMYEAQKKIPGYAALANNVFITGTWDDHDYGVNDGGVGFSKKAESQQLFLDFMGVSKDDSRRTQEGIYSSQLIKTTHGAVKIINLDTRYFRTPLTDGRSTGVRYLPNTYGEGTLLGEQQWQWLEKELMNSTADFNLIVSSIQFLSAEHGFEKWANHPHEIDRCLDLIKSSNAKGVIFLSGDRHISEFSKRKVEGLSYPIIDFTSSGLTHSYSSYKGEPNQYKIGETIAIPSFGVVQLDFNSKTAYFKIMGDEGTVLQELKQSY